MQTSLPIRMLGKTRGKGSSMQRKEHLSLGEGEETLRIKSQVSLKRNYRNQKSRKDVLEIKFT